MLSFVKSTLQLTIYEICTIRGASDSEVLSWSMFRFYPVYQEQMSYYSAVRAGQSHRARGSDCLLRASLLSVNSISPRWYSSANHYIRGDYKWKCYVAIYAKIISPCANRCKILTVACRTLVSHICSVIQTNTVTKLPN